MRALTDKLAIGLSWLCVMHCLALPIILILLPSLTVLGLEDESFHFWMLVAVLPTSLYALFIGCKQHQQHRLLAVGLGGLLVLLLAFFFGHDWLGEYGEKGLTVVGAMMVAYSHRRNYRLCQQSRATEAEECCGAN